MKKHLILSLLTLTFAFAAHAGTGGLDGMTFKGQIGPKASKDKYADDLVFKDGMFTSTACEQQGHKSGAYTSETSGKTTTFETTTMSDKGEKMQWKGTITGKVATAQITSTNAEGKTESWWYKGTLKSPSKKAKK